MIGTSQYRWDDSSIPSPSHLYRRVKKNLRIFNEEFQRWEPTPDAFAYDDVPKFKPEERGVSVSASSLAESANVPISVVNPNWETHGLAFFGVDLVRASEGMGVIPDPLEENAAHALIRAREEEKGKRNELWKPLRSKLRDQSIYVDSDDELEGFPSEPRRR